MRVIGKDKIDRFVRKNPGARKGLALWVAKTEAARWKNAADIKATFSSVDIADPYHIFDIVHNRFRLVAIVVIRNETVIVEDVMTHAAYDQWNKKKR